MSYAIELFKENFKFSCVHFTIFGPDSAERLHGHNYQAKARLEFDRVDADLGMAFDFNIAKREMKALCDELDEYVLIPEKSPYLRVSRAGDQVDFAFAKRRYSAPSSDVRFLPVSNITVEELARWLTESLAEKMKGIGSLKLISVTVEETRGQSVSFSLGIDP